MSAAGDGPLFLGVDGGGTSTVAWLGTGGGRVLGRGKAGPSNAKAVGEDNAHKALSWAITAAFVDAGLPPAPVNSACFGLAGFDRPDDKKLLARWVEKAQWAERSMFVTDGDLVVAAGTPDGHGIGVIAGTGSIAVGTAPDGRKARAGGWGHLIGDEGSAYRVALDALRLVMRRHDGRDQRPVEPDRLAERLCEALGVEGPSQIVSALYAPGFDRTKIAALAPWVLDSAADDPEVDPRILRPGGLALGEQASAVAKALDWPRGPLPLAVAGGFLLAAAGVVSALLERLWEEGYSAQCTRVEEPVAGALVLAENAHANQRA